MALLSNVLFQVFLCCIRFQERFGGELGSEVETGPQDLLCSELPSSELKGLGERLSSNSAISHRKNTWLRISTPFWLTRLCKHACSKLTSLHLASFAILTGQGNAECNSNIQ